MAPFYRGRARLDFGLRWPGTAFRMQVWKQASLPWDAHAKPLAFEPRHVSVIGFDGLVGGGTDAIAHAATPVVELGATSPYFGGLAGPGMLPVGAVELYVRTDGSPQSSWLIAILVIVGLFAFGGAIKGYRKYKSVALKRLRVLPAAAVGIKAAQDAISSTLGGGGGGTEGDAARAAKRAALMRTKSGKLPTLDRKPTYDKGLQHEAGAAPPALSAAQARWQVCRDAFEERRRPFKKIKRSRRSHMRHLLRQFKGADGKISAAKMMRLQAHQRRALRGELEGHGWKDALRDDLFILGTYAFDMLSPSPETMGLFKPVLSTAMIVVVAIVFSFLSGQYASYELEVRFGECEAEQGVINANMENVTALTALRGSLEATISAAVLAAAQANVTAAETIEGIWKELEASGKASTGKAAANEELEAETQTRMNEVAEERGATGHAAKKAVDQQAAAARGEATLTQAQIDEAAKVIAEAQSLMREEQAADSSLEKSRVATEAEEAEAAQKREAANAQIAQALAAMAAQQAKAAAEEAAASARLVETRRALAVLNNAFDPWAALRTLDPSLQDARSVAMLEAKIRAISANGYGSAEHGCTLFMPEAVSPVTLGRQMAKWAEPYEAAFLARWGARYAPSIIVDGEGHRWLSSAFVHGSWSQMFICLLNLAIIGAMVERRYGTPRFAALFILCTIGGTFLGAVADDACTVTVGATAPNLGMIGLFLNDLAVSSVDMDGDGKITLAESKAWAARRRGSSCAPLSRCCRSRPPCRSSASRASRPTSAASSPA